jgi:hypothetical protein
LDSVALHADGRLEVEGHAWSQDDVRLASGICRSQSWSREVGDAA